MSKHTPGPWKVEQYQGNCFYVVAERGKKWDNPEICDLYTDVTPEDSVTLGPWLEPKENAEANAHLIAAAPDLLGALEMMVRAFEEPRHIDPLVAFAAIERAKHVISKAKGQQP